MESEELSTLFLYTCKKERVEKISTLSLLEGAADYRRDLCLTDSLLRGYRVRKAAIRPRCHIYLIVAAQFDRNAVHIHGFLAGIGVIVAGVIAFPLAYAVHERIIALHIEHLSQLTGDINVRICLVASGYGRRLDVKADCLCKLCKGVMDGQRIRNLMVSPLTFTTAGSLPQSDTNRSTGT